MRKIYSVLPALLLGFSVQSAMAQQYVYPKEGQSPQQQQQDEYACYQWAVQQTGFDPTKAAPPPPPPAPGSGVAGGALKGALGGAVIGAIAGNTGRGAAAGAVMGGVGTAVKQNNGQQQASAQAGSAAAAYERAKATCLQARGYAVN